MIDVQDLKSPIDLSNFVPWSMAGSNVQRIIERIQEDVNINTADFWISWNRDVFNINTCKNPGIRFWASILGVREFIAPKPDSNRKTAFGFGANRKNFLSPSNFGQNIEGASVLTIDQKRRILKVRFHYLRNKCAPLAFNRYAEGLTNEGQNIFMRLDIENNSVFYVDFDPPPWLVFAYQEIDIWPVLSGHKKSPLLVRI